MDALEAINTRRSIGKVLPDPVPRELLEKLLGSAVQAPNHHRNFPWRFWVVTGVARVELGDVLARAAREGSPESEGEAARALVAKARSNPLRAPVVIVAAVTQPEPDPVLRLENVEAGAAAVQNLLLAAHALGLGAKWRTGASAYHPEVKAHFGLGPDDVILGFIYVGYPAVQPIPETRDTAEKVTWWDGEG